MAVLAEGVRVPEALTIAGGIQVSPISERIGRDGCAVMNAVLARAGFASEVTELQWMMSIGPRRPLFSLVTPPYNAAHPEAWEHLSALVTLAIDALSLTFGGSGRITGSVTECFRPDESWRTLAIAVGGPNWPVSQLRRLLPDGSLLAEFSPDEVMRAMTFQPRLAVWISLYVGAVGEARREVRHVRFWSTLESIASELIPEGEDVMDAGGAFAANDDGGKASTTHARGRVMALVVRALHKTAISADPLIAHPDHDLWEEVGVWKDIRDLVLHAGTWHPVRLDEPDPRRRRAGLRVENHAERAARGDPIDAGFDRYESCLQATVEIVLRAAIAEA